MPLGCHCGSLNGVSANFGNRYYAAISKNVEILDTTKEKPIRYVRDYYSEHPCTPKDEIVKVVEYLKEKKVQFADIAGPDALNQLVEKCSNYPVWVMSDVINYEAPARKPAATSGYDVIYEMFGSTGDFAKYLIDNKVGYIMASPIVQNPSHRAKNNYSLNQVWFWIPPKHLERAIDVGNVYGDAEFPSKEKWLKTVGGDLGIPEPEKVLEAVLNKGVFPERKPEEVRFRRQGRDAKGRFLPFPNISEA